MDNKKVKKSWAEQENDFLNDIKPPPRHIDLFEWCKHQLSFRYSLIFTCAGIPVSLWVGKAWPFMLMFGVGSLVELKEYTYCMKHGPRILDDMISEVPFDENLD
eukprot:TRINITY_DN2359_c0_g1_i2.p1 TRINITY_DN2359_c0_g1~~TRINITY_DN2359_c0_g1_i2.p1  ORF type:complete len:117 (-),score=25.52 TRINITY_DN2359_c0_g1_i2:16-327(-)